MLNQSFSDQGSLRSVLILLKWDPGRGGLDTVLRHSFLYEVTLLKTQTWTLPLIVATISPY
jgi:hypothetical protein